MSVGRWWWIVVFSILILGCGGTNSTQTTTVVTEPPPPSENSLHGQLIKQHLLSVVTGIDYPIHVYLPVGYDSSDSHYPIIYATDGQWITGGFSAAIDIRQLDIILVTIEQGPNDRRAIDYIMPGAQVYYQFLYQELLPFIEGQYRVDTTQRTLVGTSYGGLLAGLVLLMETPDAQYFTQYLSFDGSFYAQQADINRLEQQRFEHSEQLNATLLMTSALLYGNDVSVSAFQAKLTARHYSGLNIIKIGYQVRHENVAQPSFDEALDLLY